MKIISKYKDYYDYLQGIFGVDEKKILDRTEFTSTNDLVSFEDQLTLCFCGTIYKRYSYEHWRKNIRPYEEKYTYKQLRRIGANQLPQGFKNWTRIHADDKFIWYKTDRKRDTLKIPYVIIDLWNDISHPFPILKDIGFDKVMPPRDCYLAIEEFISYKEPPVPSDPTDIQRFVGKGFDKKTSFRNTK